MTSRAIQVTALAVLLAAGTIDVACAQARGGMAGTLRGNPAGTLRGNPAGTLRGNPAGTLGGSRGTTGMGVRTSPNRNMNSGTFDGR